MLFSTFELAKNTGACRSSYRRVAREMGGISIYGRETPIPLSRVLDVLGLADTLWALSCTTDKEGGERCSISLACDFAEHVLHIYEKRYPKDSRPREAIRVTRLWLRGEVRAAAWAAAWTAAWDAAWAAERQWQTKRLKEVLETWGEQ